MVSMTLDWEMTNTATGTSIMIRETAEDTPVRAIPPETSWLST